VDLKKAARLARAFRLEYGGFKATGAPAVIVSLTGLVVAAGLMRAVREAAPMVPETLREVRALMEIREAQRERAALRS
jgi:hypothetical protein